MKKNILLSLLFLGFASGVFASGDGESEEKQEVVAAKHKFDEVKDFYEQDDDYAALKKEIKRMLKKRALNKAEMTKFIESKQRRVATIVKNIMIREGLFKGGKKIKLSAKAALYIVRKMFTDLFRELRGSKKKALKENRQLAKAVFAEKGEVIEEEVIVYPVVISTEDGLQSKKFDILVLEDANQITGFYVDHGLTFKRMLGVGSVPRSVWNIYYVAPDGRRVTVARPIGGYTLDLYGKLDTDFINALESGVKQFVLNQGDVVRVTFRGETRDIVAVGYGSLKLAAKKAFGTNKVRYVFYNGQILEDEEDYVKYVDVSNSNEFEARESVDVPAPVAAVKASTDPEFVITSDENDVAIDFRAKDIFRVYTAVLGSVAELGLDASLNKKFEIYYRDDTGNEVVVINHRGISAVKVEDIPQRYHNSLRVRSSDGVGALTPGQKDLAKKLAPKVVVKKAPSKPSGASASVASRNPVTYPVRIKTIDGSMSIDIKVLVLEDSRQVFEFYRKYIVEFGKMLRDAGSSEKFPDWKIYYRDDNGDLIKVADVAANRAWIGKDGNTPLDNAFIGALENGVQEFILTDDSLGLSMPSGGSSFVPSSPKALPVAVSTASSSGDVDRLLQLLTELAA